MAEIRIDNIYLWGLVILAALGATAIVALRPRLFWPVLIVVVVWGAGMSLDGFAMVDEILAAGVLTGIFMALAVSRPVLRARQEHSIWNQIQWNQIHRWVFIALLLYMMVESFRGVIDLESPRKLRWVVYFGVLLSSTLFIVSKKPCPFAPRDRILLIIAATALVYGAVYMAHGLSVQLLRGGSDIVGRAGMTGRYALQGIEWGGTATAVFHFVIAIPAAMLLTHERSKTYRLVGWLALAIAVVEALYYDSRVGVLIVLAFIFVSLPTLGLRRFAFMSLIFALTLAIFINFVWPPWYTFDNLVSITRNSVESAWTPPSPDNPYHASVRYIQIWIAFPIISSSWDTFLFGYGFHARPEHLLGEYGLELASQYGSYRDLSGLRGYNSTEGFTALVTETGLIGLLLVSANFLLVGRAIFTQQIGWSTRSILLMSLLMTFLYLFVSNIMDNVLFYLMIMPSGLLMQLARPYVPQRGLAENKRAQVQGAQVAGAQPV